MKIGILTQPLHDNYGGLLQAYALKNTLENMGHDVVIVDRRKKISKLRLVASQFKNVLLRRKSNPKLTLSNRQRNILSKNTTAFKERYITDITSPITKSTGMSKLNQFGFDAYVVGSDQCWRPKYSPQISNYFLDFVGQNEKVLRLAYAVSFGVADWEFSEEDTSVCKELLRKFDAISVREDSGIALVKGHLGRNDVHHVLDPTMILTRDEYAQLLAKENLPVSKGDFKVYVLDRTNEKTAFINRIEQALNLRQFQVLPAKRLGKDEITDNNFTDFIYPSPLAWVQGFRDAKFVVTDSFHGTVFSIIFNVPFIAIGNKGRGMARFESLLRIFNLSDRLVTDFNMASQSPVIDAPINWDKVNETLSEWRRSSLNFLTTNLR